jgi:predicted outer membrane repeat protein
VVYNALFALCCEAHGKANAIVLLLQLIKVALCLSQVWPVFESGVLLHVQVGNARAALASKTLEATIPSANVINCNFTGNSATNGGAVLYALACPHEDRASCQTLRLKGSETHMEGNVVEGGSGADLWMVEVSTAKCLPCWPSTWWLSTLPWHAPSW